MKKLRGALVGFGFIQCKGHVPAYLKRDDVEIKAVADICDARRAIAQGIFPKARIYPDHAILLEQEAKNIDFIDIAAPPKFHAEIARAAFRKRLHVLCEKPLTCTLKEAAALLEAAQASKRVLFPCHNYKHAPVVRAIRRIMESGVIGRVSAVTLNTFRNTHAKGAAEWRTHWRREKKFSGGGIAMDHGSHTFYLAFEWLGSYPTKITAKMENLEPGKYDTEDNFSAVLTFPTGLANVHLTWTAGVRKVIYAIQGDRGAITVDDDDMQLALMRKTSGPDVAQGAVTWDVLKGPIASHWMDASHANWFSALFDQFKTAIAEKDYAGKEAQEAYRCIQLITAAYRSAAQGSREVPIS